jgi:hypothetical protein
MYQKWTHRKRAGWWRTRQSCYAITRVVIGGKTTTAACHFLASTNSKDKAVEDFQGLDDIDSLAIGGFPVGRLRAWPDQQADLTALT